MRPRKTVIALSLTLMVAGVPASGFANGESVALRAQASKAIYNLDRDRAQDFYRQAVAADPRDAGAYRGLASTLWLSITFRRGNMTVDDYMGGVARTKAAFPPPPAETVAAFNDALGRALSLARERLSANPRDADAHYEVGAAMGLRASFVATVDSSTMGAFKAAREAYDEHEKVLKLDAARKDAGLIVGTYRYIVASLAMPLRWAAYMVGFGGGREQGLRLVRGAASYVGDNQEEARFTLVVVATVKGSTTRRWRSCDSPRAVSAKSPVLARKRIDQPARRQERRRRTVSRRWTAYVRRRHAPSHVRRRHVVVPQARDRACRPRPHGAGEGRSGEGGINRGPIVGSRSRAPRAGQAGSEGRQPGIRERTFANRGPSV
jgi:hypothetical protein